jgi:serine/threonine protein kinase/Tol biopolymer transport system component
MTPDRWQKIEELYHAAMEREGSQRAAYLREVCASDEALRLEVESLLAQESRAERLLEIPAIEMAAKVSTGHQSQPSLAGRQLGAYKITSLLGAGGMGEVYQARDAKLKRDVAIKVLPAAFAHDAERLGRFQREARMLAALNHPNIAAIYGLEEWERSYFLAMELVPGETLAERLRAGAVPIEEALKIGRQIAEALEAAHEKGIIHRDLKPANVKVTPENRVKVLDFGLAKAFSGNGGLDLSNEINLTAMDTQEGRILGTPAYMSPEQARGTACDKRADIWSFGCLLYELLTGKPAFHGENTTEILAAVLRAEPDWQALPEALPQSIRALLRRCLQKDLNRRSRDAGDLRLELEEAMEPPDGTEPVGSSSTEGLHSLGRRWPVFGLGALLLGAVITGVIIWGLKPTPTPPQQVSRLVVSLPPGLQLAGEVGDSVAISPDGTHLAYVARPGGAPQVYLRAMDSMEARPIPATEEANNPFFSPDGQWLGFFAGGDLKKVSLNGGAAITLCEAQLRNGASWGDQGSIIIGGSAGLQQVSDSGGTLQPVGTRLKKGELPFGQSWPEFLPGGKAVLFVSNANSNSAQIFVESIATGERRNLVQGTAPHYARSGHLVYLQGTTLMAVPFNLQSLAVTGTPLPVMDGVRQTTNTGGAEYSLSATGLLVYVSGGVAAPRSRLVWVSRNGTEQTIDAPVHSYVNPRLSPDGRRIAVGITEQERQVWLYDLSRGTLTRFTFQGNNNLDPLWTPDGKRIVFTSNKEGTRNLFWQLADGSGGLERLTTSEHLNIPSSWSPDGRFLAFSENTTSTTGYDIWVLRLSDRKATPFLRTPLNENAAQFLPDGHWLAYASDESGRYEIYVQPYPGPGGKWQISTEGGREPIWNRNGRELFFRNGNKMMAADIATQPSFASGTPKMLFEGPYQLLDLSTPNYDVSSDGQRFLMLKPAEQAEATTQINVVLNWFEELKRKVPTEKK